MIGRRAPAWTVLAGLLLLTSCGADGSGGSGGSDPGGPPPPPPPPPVSATSGEGGPWVEVAPTSIPPATQGAAYFARLTASGGTGSGYQWQIVQGGLPPGVTLNSGSPDATITGAPAAAGIFPIVVKVRDSGAAVRALSMSLTVMAAGTPLQIATASIAAGSPGASYSQLVSAIGGSGTGYVWSVIAGSLPSGVQLAQGTPAATLSGVPWGSATANFTLQVTDSVGATATQALSLALPGGSVVYVDPTAGTSSTYHPGTRSASGGSYTSVGSLSAASSPAPGTTVIVRQGTYTQALVPGASGSPGSPITFRGYGTEQATITGASLDPAIDLSGRSHVVIDHLRVTDVNGWVRGITLSYCTIQNCTFLRALGTGTRGAVALAHATYCRIVGNWIEDGNDDLGLYLSDRNLVERNVIIKGRHTIWRIVAGNYNVVRNNYFQNTIQKIGEVFDFEGGASWLSDPVVYDATKYNVIEANVFDRTGNSGNASPFAGIQYCGQRGILRRNVFYDCIGPGLDFTLYSDEARYNTDNRACHNVFTRIGNGGVALSGSTSYAFSGNVLKNNILTGSVYNQTDMRWSWYAELDGKPVQVLTGRTNGFVFDRNVIFGTATGQDYTITYGSRTSSSNPAQHNVAWWQANYPALFTANLDVDPRFADAPANDFTLQPGSPAVNAGTWLTRTASGGTGSVLSVQDAGWFTDGFGIPGVAGDEIQLDGQSVVARIVAVNYAAGTLTLDRALSWSAGQGVGLKYSGSAPDLGAYEAP